jgi:hypothetical protein
LVLEPNSAFAPPLDGDLSDMVVIAGGSGFAADSSMTRAGTWRVGLAEVGSQKVRLVLPQKTVTVPLAVSPGFVPY